jgi:hypothetical protein
MPLSRPSKAGLPSVAALRLSSYHLFCFSSLSYILPPTFLGLFLRIPHLVLLSAGCRVILIYLSAVGKFFDASGIPPK